MAGPGESARMNPLDAIESRKSIRNFNLNPLVNESAGHS